MADSIFNSTEGSAQLQAKQNLTAGQFAASFITAIAVFTVQIAVFLLIKDRFARIYQPRTYLVPERERTKPAPPGWFKWIVPVLKTSNSEFVHRCGLDAYFFLRYLRTLLKIFVPAACVILPILLPLNVVGGRGPDFQPTEVESTGTPMNVSGLDQLAWGNVRPDQAGRYWAHWLLALALVMWICYIAFDELRNYIRMRQAYMTSPQHRLRASATTVLVSSIPTKWCTVEALEGLYDVFPGGLRNIWINRNFDELSEKVRRRDKLATRLENAETELIKMCFKKHEKAFLQAEKNAGKTMTKDDIKRRSAMLDQNAQQDSRTEGVSAGDPHQVRYSIDNAVNEEQTSISSQSLHGDDEKQGGKRSPETVLGAVEHGFDRVQRGIFGGVKGLEKGVNDTIDTTNGFVTPNDDVATEANEPSWAHNQSAGQNSTFSDNRRSRPVGIRSPSTTLDTALAKREEASGPGRRETQGPNSGVEKQSPVDSSSTERERPASPQPSAFSKFLRQIGLTSPPREPIEYAPAFEENFDHNPENALWRKYIKEKDRDTMRLPIYGWQWMPALPFVGQKVDTISYCRQEVARLNVEIENDQAHPERFPLMNSAFIQFNHQVAAHMACQSLSHHLPKQMAPRLVEIDPNDVIWDNMSIPWWQNYIRTTLVTVVVIGMIVLWAIPVAFTAALSQLNAVAESTSWLHWVLDLPTWFRSFLQGVLPPALIGLLLFLLPLTLRFLVRLKGTQSGMLVELGVQRSYFFFLFIQLFFVVTVSGVLYRFIPVFTSATGWTEVPEILGISIPIASNYFISYMLLQALSVSSGALLQIGALIGWFILAPLFDTTARDKFKRQVNLSDVQWGTFFPVYTNLACIGLIYSVISPLILIFNIITFTLFWIVYRYNTLFVTRFTRDTGGLLYPIAINLTFVGVYVMEIALIGMFFLVTGPDGRVGVCNGQGIGMIVILVLTAIYQGLLNRAFSPLFRYLPITLEDDAVQRDEEFARALAQRHGYDDDENENESEDMEDRLKANERRERDESDQIDQYELERMNSEAHRTHSREHEEPHFQNSDKYRNFDQESKGHKIAKKLGNITADHTIRRDLSRRKRGSWADRDSARQLRSASLGGADGAAERSDSSTGARAHRGHRAREKNPPRRLVDRLNTMNPVLGTKKDVEAQQVARDRLADALYSGRHDELEDLTPEQRDALVKEAFKHQALRSRRPCIWIPVDPLGVSKDELLRMATFSKHLWVSSKGQGLSSKGKTVYSGAPPDFDEVELIRL